MFIERSTDSPMSWAFGEIECDPGGIGDRKAAGGRRERVLGGDAHDDLSAALCDLEVVDAVLLRLDGRRQQRQA